MIVSPWLVLVSARIKQLEQTPHIRFQPKSSYDVLRHRMCGNIVSRREILWKAVGRNSSNWSTVMKLHQTFFKKKHEEMVSWAKTHLFGIHSLHDLTRQLQSTSLTREVKQSYTKDDSNELSLVWILRQAWMLPTWQCWSKAKLAYWGSERSGGHEGSPSTFDRAYVQAKRAPRVISSWRSRRVDLARFSMSCGWTYLITWREHWLHERPSREIRALGSLILHKRYRQVVRWSRIAGLVSQFVRLVYKVVDVVDECGQHQYGNAVRRTARKDNTCVASGKGSCQEQCMGTGVCIVVSSACDTFLGSCLLIPVGTEEGKVIAKYRANQKGRVHD